MTMQNKPQLSAEMEIVTKFRQFLANWDYAHLTRKVSVEESRQMCDEFALTLATALEEQNKRFLSQLKERKYLISKDGMAEEYLQELINDYEDILNGKGE